MGVFPKAYNERDVSKHDGNTNDMEALEVEACEET
jgi:hypothetical protein